MKEKLKYIYKVGVNFTSSLGVSEEIATKVAKRFKMFDEEIKTEAFSRLKKLHGFKNADEMSSYISGLIETQAGADQLLEESGIRFSYPDSYERFLASPMFTSIGWELKTPNDFLVLGIILGGLKARDFLEEKDEDSESSDVEKMLEN